MEQIKCYSKYINIKTICSTTRSAPRYKHMYCKQLLFAIENAVRLRSVADRGTFAFTVNLQYMLLQAADHHTLVTSPPCAPRFRRVSDPVLHHVGGGGDTAVLHGAGHRSATQKGLSRRLELDTPSDR